MAAMSNRTFGVEFELFIPYANILKLEQKYPGKINVDWDVQDDDAVKIDPRYAHILNEEEVVRQLLNMIGLSKWQIHEDSSINSGNTLAICVEIVTPILQGENGIAQVKKFCDFFSVIGKVNNSCGTHVHVGAKEFKQANKAAERLTLALLHYRSLEKVFDSLVKASRRGNKNEFARSPGKEEKIIEAYKSIIESDNRHLNEILGILAEDRYAKLNIQSLTEHGTLEFRQMHGTLNGPLITNWIKIVTSFVDMIITTEAHFTAMFNELRKENKPAASDDINNFIAAIVKNPLINKNFDDMFKDALRSQIGLNSNEIDKIARNANPIIYNLDIEPGGRMMGFNVSFKQYLDSANPKIQSLMTKYADEIRYALIRGYSGARIFNAEITYRKDLTFEIFYNTQAFIQGFKHLAKKQIEIGPVSKKDVSTVKQTINKVNKPGATGVPKHIPGASVRAIQNLKEELSKVNLVL